MTFAIDFDNTLHNPHAVMKGYKLGVPYPGAVATMRRWHDEGHKLVIFTVRATSTQSINAVADWLTYFGIPFDDITNTKGNFDMILDNTAHQYTTWDEADRYVRIMWPETKPETLEDPGVLPQTVEW
jgi:phosphoglycolate phosphatase-like HAD superfamily hydrolase